MRLRRANMVVIRSGCLVRPLMSVDKRSVVVRLANRAQVVK